MPEWRSIAGMSSGTVNHQGVETPWPLVSEKNGSQEGKTLEDINRWRSTGLVKEGAQRRRTGGKGIEI